MVINIKKIKINKFPLSFSREKCSVFPGRMVQHEHPARDRKDVIKLMYSSLVLGFKWRDNITENIIEEYEGAEIPWC